MTTRNFLNYVVLVLFSVAGVAMYFDNPAREREIALAHPQTTVDAGNHKCVQQEFEAPAKVRKILSCVWER